MPIMVVVCQTMQQVKEHMNSLWPSAQGGFAECSRATSFLLEPCSTQSNSPFTVLRHCSSRTNISVIPMYTVRANVLIGP